MTGSDAPMTVADLRAELDILGDDVIIILSKDEGGNAVSLLLEIGYSRYITGNDGARIATEEDDPEDGIPCIVLWPSS